jgi:hypothetical protein
LRRRVNQINEDGQENQMKYMLMMQGTQSNFESFGSMPPEDIKAHIKFMINFQEGLKQSGELVDAQGLAPPNQAKVVRAGGGGAAAITDGPFPEAKEFLAGYWIVDVRSPERAIEIAAQASAAPGQGGVPMNIPIELRAIGTAPQVD